MKPGVGECIAFPSIWGHWAGGPGQSTEDVEWLDQKLKEFFEKNPSEYWTAEVKANTPA